MSRPSGPSSRTSTPRTSTREPQLRRGAGGSGVLELVSGDAILVAFVCRLRTRRSAKFCGERRGCRGRAAEGTGAARFERGCELQ